MSPAFPAAIAASEAPAGPWNLDSLAAAFVRESKLLIDLMEVLKRQRGAVSKDDLAVVDETVYSAQRIFRTLAEARRRRHALLEILGVDGGLGLDDLEEGLCGRMTEEVAEARDRLKEAAGHLSRELDMNRKILSGAIATGETLIRGLRGGGGKTAGVYGPGAQARPSEGEAGLIINRQI